MTTNELLHLAHKRLSNFVNEEKILGKHEGLDATFADYMIRMAEEIKESQTTPKMHQVWPNGEITITLKRDGKDVVHKFAGPHSHRGMPKVLKIKTPEFTSNPDSEGNTWYMKRETGLFDPMIIIPLTPQEGPLIYDFLYGDWRR